MDDWEEWLALLQKYHFLLDPAMDMVAGTSLWTGVCIKWKKRVILMEVCVSEFASPFQ